MVSLSRHILYILTGFTKHNIRGIAKKLDTSENRSRNQLSEFRLHFLRPKIISTHLTVTAYIYLQFTDKSAALKC